MQRDPAFAARLKRLMNEREVTVSELARRCFGTIEETRYDRKGNPYRTQVARKRQVVRAWTEGAIPIKGNLETLAKALNCPISDLAPDDLGSGVRIGEVDRRGNVLVEMSIKVPAHIGQTIWEITKGYRR